MTNDDLMRWARKAGFDVHQITVYATSECSQELERFAALVRADEREKHQENNLMAECMDMVRDDLIRAGIISEEVPPMMLPEAIKRALKERVEAEREKCARIEPTPFEDDEGMVTCYVLPVFLEREAPADGRALRVTVDGAGYALVSYDTD